MTDIVRRLRKAHSDRVFDDTFWGKSPLPLDEAANEIERLRETLTKIASQSTSTPSKMIIEYARAAIVQSHMMSNND